MTTRISLLRSGLARSAKKAVSAGVLILSASNCYDDGGVVTGTLEVQAQRAGDLSPAPEFPAEACTQFPILPGAQRVVTYPIDADLEVEVSLTADGASVHFFGAMSFERTYDREELVDGVRIRASSSTAEYFVSLSEGCGG